MFVFVIQVSIKNKECPKAMSVFGKLVLHSSPWYQFNVIKASHISTPKNIRIKRRILEIFWKSLH